MKQFHKNWYFEKNFFFPRFEKENFLSSIKVQSFYQIYHSSIKVQSFYQIYHECDDFFFRSKGSSTTRRTLSFQIYKDNQPDPICRWCNERAPDYLVKTLQFKLLFESDK